MPVRRTCSPLVLLLLQCVTAATALAAGPASAQPPAAQSASIIRGRATFESTGDPVHGAIILVVDTGQSTTTDDQGAFEVRNVPPGRHVVIAQREHLTTARQEITVDGAAPAELSFRLGLQPLHEELTVTANPAGQSTTFEAFNSVQSLDSFDIARSSAPTLASVVQNVPGLDVRSFGPGSERPIIRGFDGDRVLILEDGIRTGDISSQSADHGTTIDPGSLDRIEVVRGPATLLYGSNAIGGVVHALTPQEAFRRTPFSGLRGQVLTEAGSGNAQAAGNANVQYGEGNWMFWAGGGSRRSGDYRTPEGIVANSAAWQSNGRIGFGYSGQRRFFSTSYGTEAGRYGIPFASSFHAPDQDHEAAGADAAHHDQFVDLKPRRHTVRLDAGVRNLQGLLVDSVRVIVSRLNWQHDEIDIQDGTETLGTRFENATTSIRAEVEQRPRGRLTGRFGASSEFRDYSATGEEALAPHTTLHAVGLFAYEQLDLGRARLMFGSRFDRTAYDTEERNAPDAGQASGDAGRLPPATRDRAYTGGSGSLGLHVELAPGTALVSTLTRSYRAPALEELYNFGSHVGNLAFEIGNTNLDREAAIGVDVSLRHRSHRARGEFNVFVYDIDNFVFPSASRLDTIDGLFVTEYLQGDSRFSGFDTQAGVRLHEHLWANVGAGYVRARLLVTSESVPRIPPLHGRLSLEMPFGGLTVTPELAWAGAQDQLFRNETATAGYTVFNVNASYILPRSHHAHIFSVSGLNLTDELYRRHTSFIKDLAPEMGRSIRVSYGVRFF